MLLSGYCGIISELSLFNLGTVLLGGTNTTLLYTMGVMMFFMGIGSYLTETRWFTKVNFDHFAMVELLLSLTCMISVPCIHLGTAWFPAYSLFFFLLASPIIGLLIGMEIPIILRLNQSLGLELRENSARVMMADYLGSLLAFLLFPFLLYPNFGIGHTAYSGAIINLLLAAMTLFFFRSRFTHPRKILTSTGILGIFALFFGFQITSITQIADQELFRDPIIYEDHTPYQQIKFTRFDPFLPKVRQSTLPGLSKTLYESGDDRFELKEFYSSLHQDLRFFINGGLQFSTLDEYRYHELLVHPAFQLTPGARKALVLGGGDGLAVREILKYSQIDTVVLVDLDKDLTDLFRYSDFAQINSYSLRDPRVHVVNQDAFLFLQNCAEKFPLVIIDFPDPYNLHLAKLFTRQFYELVRRILTEQGTMIVQSTSPLFNRAAFHCIGKTLESAGFKPIALKVSMKTFENWGFHIASPTLGRKEILASLKEFQARVPTRFLDRSSMISSMHFGKDHYVGRGEIPINDLHRLVLTKLYKKGL
jgi:spermidine synthase